MRIGFVAMLVALIGLVTISGLAARPLLTPVVALLLMAPGLLRFWRPCPVDARRRWCAHCDAELPLYSVLIPLRDEAAMVPMLQRAMSALDYPAEKLDIKFVVESRSAPTVLAVEQLLGNPLFRMVTVPDGPPPHQTQSAGLRAAAGAWEISGGL